MSFDWGASDLNWDAGFGPYVTHLRPWAGRFGTWPMTNFSTPLQSCRYPVFGLGPLGAIDLPTYAAAAVRSACCYEVLTAGDQIVVPEGRRTV